MKKGQKRKQAKSLKRRSERRRSDQQIDVGGPRNVLGHLRQARSYPIEGCWAMSGWEDGGLAVVVVARRQPDGCILYGTYLVDYYCLGLKETWFNGDIPARQFRTKVLPEIMHEPSPPQISPALAHEIIHGAIEFAGQYGFRPHRDFRHSRNVLDLADTYPRTGTVEFGYGGKPFFISGPYDNVDAIVRQLERTAGAGGYEILVGVDVPPPGEWELDDEWDGE